MGIQSPFCRLAVVDTRLYLSIGPEVVSPYSRAPAATLSVVGKVQSLTVGAM